MRRRRSRFHSLPPIGTTVLYEGRAYRFHGITPASIEPVTAMLEDLATGSWRQVPAARLTLHSVDDGRAPRSN
jgi:hypothetical protein